MPGSFRGRDVTIQTCSRRWEASPPVHDAGGAGRTERTCPTGVVRGHVSGDTMAAAVEALGLSLPVPASPGDGSVATRRRAEAAETVWRLLADGRAALRPDASPGTR